jgi:hypothetical protein
LQELKFASDILRFEPVAQTREAANVSPLAIERGWLHDARERMFDRGQAIICDFIFQRF